MDIEQKEDIQHSQDYYLRPLIIINEEAQRITDTMSMLKNFLEN